MECRVFPTEPINSVDKAYPLTVWGIWGMSYFLCKEEACEGPTGPLFQAEENGPSRCPPRLCYAEAWFMERLGGRIQGLGSRNCFLNTGVKATPLCKMQLKVKKVKATPTHKAVLVATTVQVRKASLKLPVICSLYVSLSLFKPHCSPEVGL